MPPVKICDSLSPFLLSLFSSFKNECGSHTVFLWNLPFQTSFWHYFFKQQKRMEQSSCSNGGGGFMWVCERGNAFPWPWSCAIILTQFGTMWVWDARIGRKVQYSESWVWSAVNCSDETSCKRGKHLSSYTQMILTVPKGELPSFSFLSPSLCFWPHVVPKWPRK